MARRPRVLQDPLLTCEKLEAHHALQVAVTHVGVLIPLKSREDGTEGKERGNLLRTSIETQGTGEADATTPPPARREARKEKSGVECSRSWVSARR